jgi:multiple sugar transport system substrate-binding protein
MGKKLGYQLISVLLLAALSLVGCSASDSQQSSGGNEPAAAAVNNSKPITLRVYQIHGSYTQDEVQKIMADPVKKKFPNITLEFLINGGGRKLDDYITAGDIPDMFMFAHQFTNDFTKLNLLMDMSSLIKSHSLDLNKFDPTTIADIRDFGPKGEIYDIPYSITFSALYYNKDIFDKFGVPYPKDGMTWDDAIDLGRRVARTDGGVVYKPLEPFTARHLGSVLSLPYVDPKTNKATVATDGWRTVFKVYQDIRALPGNNETKPGPVDAFLKDQNLAMLANYSGMLGRIEEQTAAGTMFNWDFTSYPNFPQAPGKGLGLEAHVLTISQTTKYKEEAFQVISFLTEKENQILASQNKRLTSLNDSAIKAEFGKNSAFLNGKNLTGVFKNVAARNPAPSIYSNLVLPLVNTASNNVAAGKTDINTALKDADEKANQAIQADLAK